MPFDLTKFLLCSALAENVDPDTAGANQLALAASMMNMGLMQTAVFAVALAQSQAQAGTTGTSSSGTPSSRRSLHGRRARAPMAKVRVPGLRQLSERKEIEDLLAEHKLEARFQEQRIPELTGQGFALHWPAEGADVDEGTEVQVMLLLPEEAGNGESIDAVAARPRRKAGGA